MVPVKKKKKKKKKKKSFSFLEYGTFSFKRAISTESVFLCLMKF